MAQEPPDRSIVDQIADQMIRSAQEAKTLQDLRKIEREFLANPLLPQPQYARIQEVIEAVKQELRLGSG